VLVSLHRVSTTEGLLMKSCGAPRVIGRRAGAGEQRAGGVLPGPRTTVLPAGSVQLTSFAMSFQPLHTASWSRACASDETVKSVQKAPMRLATPVLPGDDRLVAPQAAVLRRLVGERAVGGRRRRGARGRIGRAGRRGGGQDQRQGERDAAPASAAGITPAGRVER
jgi:hypothetical protein